jgi:hypothetical protein
MPSSSRIASLEVVVVEVKGPELVVAGVDMHEDDADGTAFK